MVASTRRPRRRYLLRLANISGRQPCTDRLPTRREAAGGYLVLLVQTAFAPRAIVALAYDSGGVTTSTVTVPLVAALGLGLASSVPGRSPVMDGFGMIALTALFPIMTVLAYAQLGDWLVRRRRTN